MKELNSYNAFGFVQFRRKHLAVMLVAFTDDGFMHTVRDRFPIEPELPVKALPLIPFAGELVSGREPQFRLGLNPAPDGVAALEDEGGILGAIYAAAYELMVRLGFEPPWKV